MVYEICIVEKPTKKEEEDGAVEKLVFGPKAVVARDPQGAVVAVMMGGEVPKLDVSKIELHCRPFVQSPK